MPQVKSVISGAVKKDIKEVAKGQNKSEAECVREALKMYISSKKAQK